MKKIYYGITAVLVLVVIVYLYYYPIVINSPGEMIDHSYSEKVYKEGDVIKPFEDFDFDSGKYSAYLIIKDRTAISDAVLQAGILKTEDIDLLRGLQNMEFVYTEGDMATVENEFLLYDGYQLVFRTGIVFGENSEGFQNQTFGWIQYRADKKLADHFEVFDACFPIAILPK